MTDSTCKLAVVGSRYFKDYLLFTTKLDEWIKINGKPEYIVSGGATGADRFAEVYAKNHNIPTIIFKPDWNKYGKAAGMIRNNDIVNNCTHLIAFPSRTGKGTQDSISKAEKMSKPIEVHYID